MYEKNKDLILVTLFGFIYYAIVIALHQDIERIPLGVYFIAPFIVAILMGFALREPSQMIEWPLCFFFGGITASVHLLFIVSLIGMPMSILKAVFIMSQTFAWFGSLSAMILIGLLVGGFFRASYNLVLGSLNVSIER